MLTEILDSISEIELSIGKAVNWLKNGIPVAFPTETVYGLGAGLFDINAIEKIFRIKGRKFSNPLSAHISNVSDVEFLCSEIKDEFYILAEEFLPGPLSIIMKKKKEVSDLVTGGGDTLSIRIPDNEIFLRLSQNFGQPIAGTSANLSGRPSPVTAMHVFDDLQGEIPVILDGGSSRYSIESTVISLVGSEPVLIRPGAIPQTAISKILGKEIISLNKQITLFEHNLTLSKESYKIYTFDSIDSLLSFYRHNKNRKIMIMSRNNELFKSEKNYVKTDVSTFFTELRNAEKNGIEMILVDVDDYVKQSDVLRHRLKIY